MAAVYDFQVKKQLEKYDRVLKYYPISAKRRKEKVKRLRSFLQSLSNNPKAYAICNSKKLGQIFNIKGETILTNLKQTQYEDESKTQWRVSFFQISANKVKIYRLMQAAYVDESFKSPLRLTEAQFKRLLTEFL